MDTQTAFILAQCISIGAGIIAIVIKQIKAMRMILLSEVITNLLASLNYLLLGGDAGAIVSVLAIVHSLVMFLYSSREKTPPIALTAVFLTLYLACSTYTIITKGDLMELFPGMAAACFALALMQKPAMIYRLWSMANSLCWIVYDVYTASYVMLIVHLGILISAVVALIRIDGALNFKKKN